LYRVFIAATSTLAKVILTKRPLNTNFTDNEQYGGFDFIGDSDEVASTRDEHQWNFDTFLEKEAKQAC
jgi:hypothetical protein